ncbi:MAG TPA: hypothetical protein VN176_07385 [Verrucomicrobiae bacterium]|jgi:hypothetical protein|nr:hypothetical protein [Verrucomicrobiae bacterium]
MFTGTTIEELMASVERAEQHARQQQETTAFDLQQNALDRMDRMEWQELVGVA